MVYDPASRRDLYARNRDLHFIPASNAKLVVTIAALGILGPDFRYETAIDASGVAGDSVVTTLRIRGSGDPTLSARFASGDFAAIDSLAETVRAAGIRVVTREVVADASLFDPPPVNDTWEVGDLPLGYAAPVGALAIAEGTFRIVVTPGAATDSPGAVHVIGGDDLQPVVARITTDTARARATRDIDFLLRRDTIHLTGAIGLGAAPDTLTLAVTDPAAYAARAFAAALRRKDIRVARVRVVRDSTEAHTAGAIASRWIASRKSPPLGEIVAAILKPSQNWIAEQLLLTLGATRGDGGGWREGIAVERRYLLDSIGIDSAGFSLRDASGLSAQNLLSPGTIVQLLEHADRAPWGETFRLALAQPGVDGTTLSSRLPGLEGRLFAKTGTIANVNSLSGYVTTDGGRKLIFSIMSNGSGLPSAPVRRAIDALITAIAREGGSQ